MLSDILLYSDRLSLLDALPKNGIVAEIGVHRGDFARHIIERTTPQITYLVDRWKEGQEIANGNDVIDGFEAMKFVENRFEQQILDDNVKLIQCDSQKLNNYVKSNYFDWVYLDTWHLYPDTLYELRSLASLIKHDGMILGHDYDQITYQGYYSVARSVEEFINESDYVLFALTYDCPASFGLMKKLVFDERYR